MNLAQTGIPEEARAWLKTQLDDYQVLEAYRNESQRTGVWRVHSHGGNYFFKINRKRNRWGTEVFAYRNWTSVIEPYAPKLQAVFDAGNNPGFLISEVNGIPLSETKLCGNEVDKAYYKAGVLLRRLHDSMNGNWFGYVSDRGLPFDGSGNPLAPERMHNLPGQKLDVLLDVVKSGESLGCFNQPEGQVLQWAVESVGCYTGEKPIPTSEDFTPGNWLVDERGTLAAVIDFENMLWGDRIFPFTRLINDYFPDYPSGERAFYDGYGGCPPQEQPDQIRIACAIYAAHYVTLGNKINNKEYIRRGREAFNRIIGQE